MAVAKSEDLGKLVLRLAVGVVLLFHGAFKLVHGVDVLKRIVEMHGWPGFLAYGPYLAEVLAPILIILGFRTRLAAVLVVINMSVAIGLMLRPLIFAVKAEGGGWAIELEALILLCALALFFTGGGRFGITKGKSGWD